MEQKQDIYLYHFWSGYEVAHPIQLDEPSELALLGKQRNVLAPLHIPTLK